MFKYSSDDVLSCLLEAKNLNAAAKKFMKGDTSGDPRTAKFIKAFRDVAKTPKKERLQNFVEKTFENYPEHLLVACRNAYGNQIDSILDPLIETYAENFNATYSQSTPAAITISNEEQFSTIGKSAVDAIISSLKTSELPNNKFMQQTVAHSLFDRVVLEELEKRIGNDYA